MARLHSNEELIKKRKECDTQESSQRGENGKLPRTDILQAQMDHGSPSPTGDRVRWGADGPPSVVTSQGPEEKPPTASHPSHPHEEGRYGPLRHGRAHSHMTFITALLYHQQPLEVSH